MDRPRWMTSAPSKAPQPPSASRRTSAGGDFASTVPLFFRLADLYRVNTSDAATRNRNRLRWREAVRDPSFRSRRSLRQDDTEKCRRRRRAHSKNSQPLKMTLGDTEREEAASLCRSGIFGAGSSTSFGAAEGRASGNAKGGAKCEGLGSTFTLSLAVNYMWHDYRSDS